MATRELTAREGEDLVESLRADYSQPRCPVCGRFAARGDLSREWRFACLFWTGSAWEHNTTTASTMRPK